MTSLTRVLITGAHGQIGRVLREGLRGVIPTVRLSDLTPTPDLQPHEEDAPADLRDPQAVLHALQGVDAVVHLGGIPDEAPYERILDVNVRGTAHVFEAARAQGVRRVLFASSIHAVGFYPVADQVGSDALPRPDTQYGVSKVYGEALGRLYHDKYGLQVACLRIGSFEARPMNARHLNTWVSHRDLTQLVRVLLGAPSLGYAVVYGLSGNRRGFADNRAAFALGYQPQDDAEAYAADLQGTGGEAPALNGGPFTDPDYTGSRGG